MITMIVLMVALAPLPKEKPLVLPSQSELLRCNAMLFGGSVYRMKLSLDRTNSTATCWCGQIRLSSINGSAIYHGSWSYYPATGRFYVEEYLAGSTLPNRYNFDLSPSRGRYGVYYGNEDQESTRARGLYIYLYRHPEDKFVEEPRRWGG